MKSEIKKRIEQIKKGQVPHGYKTTKIGTVPNEWEEKKLGEIGIFKKGKGISSSLIIDKGLPAMMYGDIYVKYNIKFHSVDYRISEETAQKSTPIYNNDLLFTCSGETALEIGKCICYLGKEKVYIGGDILALTPQKYNGLFLAYQQNIYESVKQKARLGQGHSVVHIYQNSLEKLCICCPSLQEQQKIAKILSIQDKVIELKEKLIEEKQKQKKYLMQNLLTGKIRLKSFTGEWKKYVMGNLGNTYSGLSGKNKDDFGKGKPYIPYTNIFLNPIIDVNELGYVDVLENEKQSKVCYGDIFFTTSSETPEEVGMSSVLLENVDELYLNSFCFGFRLNNFSVLSPIYASHYFRGDTFRNILNRLAQGATRFNLSKNNLLKSILLLPPLEEQKAIAEILSTQDKEIKLLQKELEEEKQKKKALMQLLLTGIVRV